MFTLTNQFLSKVLQLKNSFKIPKVRKTVTTFNESHKIDSFVVI